MPPEFSPYIHVTKKLTEREKAAKKAAKRMKREGETAEQRKRRLGILYYRETSGREIEVGTWEAKSKLTELLRRANEGQIVIVMNRLRPVQRSGIILGPKEYDRYLMLLEASLVGGEKEREVGVESEAEGFRKIQRRLVEELDRRTMMKELPAMELDQMTKIMKVCRENLVAISQNELVVSDTKEIKLMTKPAVAALFGEKGKTQ